MRAGRVAAQNMLGKKVRPRGPTPERAAPGAADANADADAAPARRSRRSRADGAAQVACTTVPYFWTSQYGKSVRYCGHALGFDDVIVDGDLAAYTFIAYYISARARARSRPVDASRR